MQLRLHCDHLPRANLGEAAIWIRKKWLAIDVVFLRQGFRRLIYFTTNAHGCLLRRRFKASTRCLFAPWPAKARERKLKRRHPTVRCDDLTACWRPN